MEEISGELIYLSSQPWKQNKNVPTYWLQLKVRDITKLSGYLPM